MQNRKTITSIVLKSSLSIFSLIAFLSEWATYGPAAPRLFGYWATLLAAIFYCLSVLYLFIHRRTNLTSCAPRFGTLVVINLLIIMVGATIFRVNQIDFPTAGGFSGVLLSYIIPILALVDWLNFTPKGALRTTDPWTFLAPSLIYASMIIITTEQLPSNYQWLYPYSFLNYEAIGLLPMVWLLLIIITLIVVGGYVLFSIDFVMSGKLAHYVVLPKVKTVVVVEAPHPEISIDGVTKPQPRIHRNPKTRGTINDVKKVKPQTINDTTKATSSPMSDSPNKKKDKLANVGKLQPIKDVDTQSDTNKEAAAKKPATKTGTPKTPKVNPKSPKSSKPTAATKGAKKPQKPHNAAKSSSREVQTKKSEFKIPQPTSTHNTNSKKTDAPAPAKKSPAKTQSDKTSSKDQTQKTDTNQAEFKLPNQKTSTKKHKIRHF